MNRPKRKQPEHDLQFQAVEFLTRALPVDAVFLHIPTGANFPVQFKVKLKRLGMKAGVPDLVVFWTRYDWQGGRMVDYDRKVIWFELKRPGTAHWPSARSEQQEIMGARLEECGHDVYTVDTVEAIEAALRECRVPLRASLGRPAQHKREIRIT